jgi:hypothetical protein
MPHISVFICQQFDVDQIKYFFLILIYWTKGNANINERKMLWNWWVVNCIALSM